MRRLAAPLVHCVLALGLLLAAAGCGAPGKDRVTIMVPWSDDEFQAFYSVVRAFEKDNPGIDVEPQVTRALNQQLDAAVAAKAAPDLAVLPSVGAIAKYAHEKGRPLRPLRIDTSSFVEPFRELAMNDGDVLAVPVKADVKSLVWYDRERTPKPPGTWAALLARNDSWCLGLESGPTSGWPGADWIADILLADQGVDTYREWVSGGRSWTSKPVRKAWTTWRGLVDRVPEDAAMLPFKQATAGMRKTPPTCSLSHGALSATDFPARRVTDGTYSYVTPSRNVLQVSADFIGKFTDDNAGADRFIRYLASAEAQQAWVDAPRSFALSASTKVTEYRNSRTQSDIAAMLRSGHTLCFSAADAMDPDVSAAFYRAVLEYANGADLTKLLNDLDSVQRHLGKDSPPPTPLCGTPNQP